MVNDILTVVIVLAIGLPLIVAMIWHGESVYHQSLEESARRSSYATLEEHLIGYPPEMHDDVTKAWEKVRGKT